MTILAIISLFVGAFWGWMLYVAIIHKVEWCAVACAVSFAMYQADKFYLSPLIRGFIKGFTGE